MASFVDADTVAVLLKTTFDQAEAARVDLLLEQASDAIRAAVGQQVDTATGDVTLAGTTDTRLFLPGLSAQLPTAVTINGTAYTDWSFDESTGSLFRRSGWVVCDDNGFPHPVVVTYTSGYTEVPAEIARICCQVVIRALNTSPGLNQETAGDWSGAYDASGVTLTAAEAQQARAALDLAPVVA